MSAEYCLKQYLRKHKINNVMVSSAGTEAKTQTAHPATLDILKSYGINPKKHIQRKLNKELLKGQDVIIAMAKNHQDFILKHFKLKVPLYNEVAFNKKTSIFDVREEVNIHHQKAVHNFITRTVNNIHGTIPVLFEKLNVSNLLFYNFVQGRWKHRNGFPFLPLYETKHSIAFMSIDIPEREDGHVLVIPKKRYPRLEEIPDRILSDLIKTVSIVGRALTLSHEGYNVLLNNGRSAGQYIYHTHFHIIPRKENDNIEIELWKNRTLTKKQFLKLNNKIKKNIKTISSKLPR
jgi:diadenosine tetraphosphate (Ap4A) HIT family hydrolase/protein-tyrosine-phosphatase